MVEIRLYRDGDEEQIADLLKKCFPTFNRWGVEPSEWLSLEDLDYGFKRHNAIVAVENGKIVGHVHLIMRRVYLRNCSIDICGIANVCTHPDHRGRGIASSMLREALRICRERGYSVASLLTGYGGEAHRIYRSLGFSDTAFLKSYIAVRENVERILEIYSAEDLETEDLDMGGLEEAMDLYERWCRGLSLCVQRPRSYWEEKILKRIFYYSFFHDKPESSARLIFKRSSSIAGYSISIIGSRTSREYWPRDSGIILEAVPARRNLIGKILIKTLEHLYREGARVFRAYLPYGEKHVAPLRFFEGFRGAVVMDYILDLKALLENISMDLTRRAVATGIGGGFSICLESPYGGASITVDGGSIAIDGGCNAPHRILLERDGVVRLIYGASSIDDLLLSGLVKEARIDRRSLEILRILFPKRVIHISMTDQW